MNNCRLETNPNLQLDKEGECVELQLDGYPALRGRADLFNGTWGSAVLAFKYKVNPNDESWIEIDTSTRLSSETASPAPINASGFWAVRLEVVVAGTAGARARASLLASPSALGATGAAGATGATGATGAAGAAGGTFLVKTMAADQSRTSNTTLANVTDLVFAIGASEEWVYQFMIRAGDAALTTGLKLAAALPVGATGVMTIRSSKDPAAVGDGSSDACESTTTPATGFDIASFNASHDTVQVVATLRVLNSTNAGNVQLQFAQSTSDATPLTFKAGSFGVGFKKA